MKALSLWQPWASLMATGLKTIETRSWTTQYRGPLAIHAAKRPLTGNEKSLLYGWACRGRIPSGWLDSEPLPYGAILAVVELVECRLIPRCIEPWFEKEEQFGNYARGRWAWITRNVRRLPEPFSYRGAQGLFDAQFPQPDIANAIVPAIRSCRVCGCTDDDCRQCIARTGRPCHWVEPDLCSACAPKDPA